MALKNNSHHKRLSIQEQLTSRRMRSKSLYPPVQEPPRRNPVRPSAAAPQHGVPGDASHRSEKPTSRSQSSPKKRGEVPQSPGFSSSPKYTTRDGGRRTAKGSSSGIKPAPWTLQIEAPPPWRRYCETKTTKTK